MTTLKGIIFKLIALLNYPYKRALCVLVVRRIIMARKAREWKKRELYEKYASVCLSEEEYAFLEEKGVIPKNLHNLYTGEYTRWLDHKPYDGPVIDNIVDSGTKLFLENWGRFASIDLHTAMFFFDNFLVILPEPTSNGGPFWEVPDALPVAIPICNIKKYEKRAYTDGECSLSIYFNEKGAFSAYNYGSGSTKPSIPNFSHHVNAKLIGRFSMGMEGSKFNQNKIIDRLDSLIENCCKGYKQRQDAASILFTDLNTIVEFQFIAYLDKKTFIKEMKERVSFISPENFPNVVNALNTLPERCMKVESELQACMTDRDKKVADFNDASFFGKKRKTIREEIKLIDEKIDKLNLDIEECYNATLAEILKVTDSKTPIAICEDFDIPDEYVSLAKEVYLSCKNRNVTKLETEDEKMIFSLICRKHNVPDEYQTESFFNGGMQIIHNESQANNVRAAELEINKSRIRKAVLHNDAKDKAMISGPIKYTRKAMKEQAEANSMAKATQLLGELSKIHTQAKAVKSDAAILGGLASGLAGPAVGMITYAEVEASNARAEAEAAEVRERGREQLVQSKALESNYQSIASSLGGQVAAIHDRLYDTSNTDKYFSYLTCGVNSYVVEEDGMMTLDVTVDFVKSAELNGLPIIIDGSFCIDIKEDDKIVGDAYVCAPGFDEMNLAKVGFNAEKNFKAIGLPTVSDFSSQKNYTFDFRPINIWMIEK